jgi:phytanoyl-CoA hydroxylase
VDLVREFSERGFVRLEGFADRETCDRMLARVVEISRDRAAGSRTAGLVMPEVKLAGSKGPPESRVSKIFSLHRDTVFAEFAHSSDVLRLVKPLIAPSLVCFLSQFIFKNPGAWGQPWHQDSFYFPFEPARPIVGVWLAVTEATLENGCLHVLPGSQHEPVHHHVPDARPDSQYGYYEIVDHDMSAAVPVLMQAGDLLLFDSHLMHRSTDNVSSGIRAAMVYHYAMAGTRQLSPSAVNDFVPV